MKKKNYIFSLLTFFLSLTFFSCSETEEVGKYDNWQERNEAFMDSLTSVYDGKRDPELKFLVSTMEKRYPIYYKVVEGDDAEVNLANHADQLPYYNSTVSCYYYGTTILNDKFDGNFDGKEITPYNSPTSFVVNNVIAGWTEALQRMKPGDRWKVYIPWQQAYGSSGKDGILGYSTLIFDMKLDEITSK